MKKDAIPLVPGQIAELKFGLQPISVLVKKGHRLRVAIAGHDKDTFIRIPADGTPMIAVQRNNRGLSMIELPVVKLGSGRYRSRYRPGPAPVLTLRLR